MLAGGKRKRERKGRESIHPSAPEQGLLNGIPYDGWRERGKARWVVALRKENLRTSRSLEHPQYP
jgi:hypothetical protein